MMCIKRAQDVKKMNLMSVRVADYYRKSTNTDYESQGIIPEIQADLRNKTHILRKDECHSNIAY